MFRSPNRANRVQEDAAAEAVGYALERPTVEERWNPWYEVPRNSFATHRSTSTSTRDHVYTSQPRLEKGIGSSASLEDDEKEKKNKPKERVEIKSVGRQGTDRSTRLHTRRDFDANADIAVAHDAYGLKEYEGEEFSHLVHWLETLSEIYMNNLDNLARWDPRWLNVARRERFEGLSSASITVVDYLEGPNVDPSDPPIRTTISNKTELATTLEARPEECAVRVVMVNDLSRYVMGVLGQLYSIDPEFWFNHLLNSGYAASDGGLKLKNAVWLNWAERESQFHHRAMPDIGQRTPWNSPRRQKGRSWVHMRWGRLGLMNYLGRKGFYEDEIELRLGDGRYLIERDVTLDRHGLLLTKKRQKRLDKAQKKAEKKQAKDKKKKKKEGTMPRDAISSRYKTTNVYRAYSTFDGLPMNPSYWDDRDLRVMAPEGVSHWSGLDENGKKTVVILFDPMRSMRDNRKDRITPSLTFMPRAMEIESYDDEEMWRMPEAGETYLDPLDEPLSKDELHREKVEAAMNNLKWQKKRLKKKLSKLGKPLRKNEPILEEEEEDDGYQSVSTYKTDTEYDEEYAKELRLDYRSPRLHHRHRDFARKYALSTLDLFLKYMTKLATADVLEDNALFSSIIIRMSLDDLWQLLSEIRLDLDNFDNAFAGDFNRQLLESVGNTKRQNVHWMRCTLREVSEWTAHLSKSATRLSQSAELLDELKSVLEDIETLRVRTEQTLSVFSTAVGLAQSNLVIDQTSGINKLTELAFFFVPVSFITAVFSMQVHELTSKPPPLWSWGVALALVVLVTYCIRSFLRSPSVRVAGKKARAMIITRFANPKAGDESGQFNTIGNRAIAKYVIIMGLAIMLVVAFLIVIITIYILIEIGIWLGAAAVSLYFIITRWPEPAVLIPCFIALPLCMLGMWVAVYFDEVIGVAMLKLLGWSFQWAQMMLPDSWMSNDGWSDEDLAKEGVNLYARQAFVLAT